MTPGLQPMVIFSTNQTRLGLRRSAALGRREILGLWYGHIIRSSISALITTSHSRARSPALYLEQLFHCHRHRLNHPVRHRHPPQPSALLPHRLHRPRRAHQTSSCFSRMIWINYWAAGRPCDKPQPYSLPKGPLLRTGSFTPQCVAPVEGNY